MVRTELCKARAIEIAKARRERSSIGERVRQNVSAKDEEGGRARSGPRIKARVGQRCRASTLSGPQEAHQRQGASCPNREEVHHAFSHTDKMSTKKRGRTRGRSAPMFDAPTAARDATLASK